MKPKKYISYVVCLAMVCSVFTSDTFAAQARGVTIPPSIAINVGDSRPINSVYLTANESKFSTNGYLISGQQNYPYLAITITAKSPVSMTVDFWIDNEGGTDVYFESVGLLAGESKTIKWNTTRGHVYWYEFTNNSTTSRFDYTVYLLPV